MANDSIIKKQNQNAFFKLRKSAKFSHLDLAGYWSYPAFVRYQKDKVYWLYLILPTIRMPQKKKTALFRPKSAIITLPNSKTVVRYDNFRLGHNPFPEESWDQPKDMFPHKSIASLTREHLRQKEIALLEMYEKESLQFGNDGNLSDSFRSSWQELIHPIFLQYLEHLAPEFIRVLRSKIEIG